MKRDVKRKYLSPQETALFCDQIALILKSGILLEDGLEILYETNKDSKYADKFKMLLEGIQKNSSFYDCLKSMDLFSLYMVNMVHIGEKTGKLDDVMHALGKYYAKQANIKKSLKSAMLYPCILIAMMAVVTTILVIKVLPIFNQIYKNLGAQLYSTTSSFMNLSMITGNVILIIIGIALIVIISSLILLQTKQRDIFIEKIGNRFKCIRCIQDKIAAWRFASVISMMFTSGYHMEEAMELAPTIIFNNNFQNKMEKCRKLMEQQSTFADAITQVGIFDGIQNKMIRIGAVTGHLDKVMEQIAVIYENEIDESISYVVSLTEPTLVATLSIIIGSILLTVMLPLVSIISSLG